MESAALEEKPRKPRRRQQSKKQPTKGGSGVDVSQDGSTLCIICTDPVVIGATGECNHMTCHVCSLRLRALYKNNKCALCKTELTIVIFTKNLDAKYESIDSNQLVARDEPLGIGFTTDEISKLSLSLLHFNCPFRGCATACANGYPELKQHVRDTHGMQMCDICIANKKVFAHEHQLFTASGLRQHKMFGDKRDKSFKGHPRCEFCNQFFYGSDELYDHCKKKHETCFLCERRGIREEYYRNYGELEDHFRSDHKLCPSPECLAKKFVVFDNEIDLHAHDMEVHSSGYSKSSNGRRDFRHVNMEFRTPQPAAGQVQPAAVMHPLGGRATSYRSDFSGELNESRFNAIGPRGDVVRAQTLPQVTSNGDVGSSLLCEEDFPSLTAKSRGRAEGDTHGPAQSAKSFVKPSWIAASSRVAGSLNASEFPPLVASASTTGDKAVTLGNKSRKQDRVDLEGVSLERALEQLVVSDDAEFGIQIRLVYLDNLVEIEAFKTLLHNVVCGYASVNALLEKLATACKRSMANEKNALTRLESIWKLLAKNLEQTLASLSSSELKSVNIVTGGLRPNVKMQSRASGKSVWSKGATNAPALNANIRETFADVYSAWSQELDRQIPRLTSSFGKSTSLSSMSTRSLAKSATAAPKILIIKDSKKNAASQNASSFTTLNGAKKFGKSEIAPKRLDSNAYQSIADRMIQLKSMREGEAATVDESDVPLDESCESSVTKPKKKKEKVLLFSAKG